jgi:O-methyltransferase involved in polyketide biosynthesis
MEKKSIALHQEQETLLIPLFAKAQPNPILEDAEAQKILASIDYDFARLHVPQKTAVTLLIRARKMDETVREFLAAHPKALILHLGCGLDSRCLRVGTPQAQWYDLDLPDVIQLRRAFYSETESYHMLASSVADLAWLDQIPPTSLPVLIIAEGLFMYLPETSVKQLLLAIHDRFPHSQIIFDAFSQYTTERIQAHPSLQKTGARILWGIDDLHQIETWAEGIHLQEEWYFSQSPAIPAMKGYFRFMFRLSARIPLAQKAHRILRYQL